MLHLSDKELDRLSKEAAQEYDPGDILGANSWEKLQVGLDTELGPSGPNPLRHIRRFPFYYAPALLLVVGLSYYLSRHAAVGTRGTASGGPPGRAAQATAGTTPAAGTKQNDLSQNNVNNNKSTSTLSAPTTTTTAPAEKDKGGAVPGGDGRRGDARATNDRNGGAATREGNDAGAKDANLTATGVSDRAGNHVTGSAADRGTSPESLGNRRNGRGGRTLQAGTEGSVKAVTARSGHAVTTRSGQAVATGSGQNATIGNGQGATTDAGGPSGAKQEREMTYSRTPGLQSTRKTPVIGDSALRAFTLKSSPPQLRMRALYIKRTLQFGLLIAPDYTSVNSLAGDKAGSTFGLTLEYEFANKWYVSSGLLVSRKNYAASSENYHAPSDWYTSLNIQHLDIVKGSFEMLEVPLNLRYDFSVAGSTLFFASVGLSSYLLTSENCNYYMNPYGYGEIMGSWKDPAQKSYLFSAANLSLGVETGISNSLTILIAPYAKLPVRNVGIGQVQMNSVGIDFVLKYSPITSRKRR